MRAIAERLSFSMATALCVAARAGYPSRDVGACGDDSGAVGLQAAEGPSANADSGYLALSHQRVDREVEGTEPVQRPRHRDE